MRREAISPDEEEEEKEEKTKYIPGSLIHIICTDAYIKAVDLLWKFIFVQRMRTTCFLSNDLFAYYHFPVGICGLEGDFIRYASAHREREHRWVMTSPVISVQDLGVCEIWRCSNFPIQ